MARRDRDRNEVEIDLEKYMALLDQLDDQEDVIKQLKDDARKLKEGVEPPKRKFIDLFLDSNDLNENIIFLNDVFRYYRPSHSISMGYRPKSF